MGTSHKAKFHAPQPISKIQFEKSQNIPYDRYRQHCNNPDDVYRIKGVLSIMKKELNGRNVISDRICHGIDLFSTILIRDRGFFIYFGDYDSQQIPFYIKVHEAVRSGKFFWDMKTDLGSSIYTSYSFYLLGSPFF